jgi:ActR/RegA family two-component response regulator
VVPVGGVVSMLVAEDDALVARMVARSFKKIAPEIAVTSDAAEAIRTLESLAVDVVWTDLDLGERGDGIDVLERARALHPEALLVLVTGNVHLVSRRPPPEGTHVFAKIDITEAIARVRAHVGALSGPPSR